VDGKAQLIFSVSMAGVAAFTAILLAGRATAVIVRRLER
jgi:hypothetical protein